jgi:hypothetical protein
MIPINTTLREKLAELTNCLFWMSESDFPFQVITWDTNQVTREQLLQLTYHPPDAPVEVITVDEFFAPAFSEKEWYGCHERATLQRYRQLLTFLTYHLSDIKVYRVGKNTIYVYILGMTRDDNLAGVATKVLETLPQAAKT